ncbi:type II toxin-antitoxin system HicA family toxin [bacterium]|nr:type II toxin-antitoxin system HicA family toxin [bacterium]
MRILKTAGFHEDHQSGSHVIMHSTDKNTRVSVPFHRRDLPAGTVEAILKAAHIKREEILALIYS